MIYVNANESRAIFGAECVGPHFLNLYCADTFTAITNTQVLVRAEPEQFSLDWSTFRRARRTNSCEFTLTEGLDLVVENAGGSLIVRGRGASMETRNLISDIGRPFFGMARVRPAIHRYSLGRYLIQNLKSYVSVEFFRKTLTICSSRVNHQEFRVALGPRTKRLVKQGN